jgi:hypothetical protein
MGMADTITRLFGHSMEVREKDYDEWVAKALTEFCQRPLTQPTTPLLGFPSELIAAYDVRFKSSPLDLLSRERESGGNERR